MAGGDSRANRLFKKTVGITVLAIQQVTVAPRVVVSEDIDVSGKTSISFFIRVGRQNENVWSAALNVRVEASPEDSGTNWIPTSLVFSSAVGSGVGSQVVNGACAAGQRVILMVDTTGFAAGDIVFIHNPVLSQSEFGRVASVVLNTSVTLETNLQYAQTGATVYDQSELALGSVDCENYKRLRVVVDGSGVAQNFVIEVKATSSEGLS